MESTEVDCEVELVIDEREEGEIDDEDEEGRRFMEDIEEEDDGKVMLEDIEEEDEDEVDVVEIEDEEGKKDEEGKEKEGGSKMTLRQHSEQSKPSTSSSSSNLLASPDATTLCLTSLPSSSSMPSGSGLSTTSSTAIPLGGHKRMQWTIGDMLLFYEGVKQYGKDFDALYRVMSKRKMEINKEQLRNFFFNFYKQVRAGADMKEEDWPAEMSRDARDLFVVINGCEWRKRMGNYKFEAAKLRTLIVEGTVTTRLRCKKQHVTIKTPCCPALLQFFSFNRRITRFPQDIVLYLSPRSYRDGTNVMSRGQSRNLLIRLNTCDRVERIFDLLQHKWKGEVEDEDDEYEDEEEEEGEREKEKEKRPFTVRLHPSKHTLMGEVSFTPSTTSYGNVSVNMLQEDRTKTESIKRQIKKGHDPSEVCYRASQSLIPHLSLSRSALLEGLTRETAGSASIAELYAVCGLSREIVLLYSIDEPAREEAEEPWDILVDLLGRGYGDAMMEKRPAGGINKTPSRDDPMQMGMMEEEEFVIQPQAKRLRLVKEEEVVRGGLPHFVPQSTIVTKEMNDFAAQLRSISSAPRPKRRSPVRLKASSTTAAASTSASQHSQSGGGHRRTSSLSLANTRTPTTPTRAGAAAAARASAASTPGRLTTSSILTTFPKLTATAGNDALAMALKAALASPGNSLLEAPSPSSSRAARRIVPAAVFTSPTKTQGSLPSDVRASMEQMLSQNSLDYCMEFAQLISCTTLDSSPSKLSRL